MKKYIAELLGTFVLTFFGCGTAVVVECGTNPAGYLTTALAFGLSIVAMAYSIGNISGCHINPAVSFAMLLSGKMKKNDFVGYIVAQVVGALLAGLLLMILVGRETGLGANGLYNGKIFASFIIEVILTFVFVLAILGVTSKAEFSSVAGIVIGLTLAFVHILGIGFTGTSVNPARSIGPAIFAGGAALKALPVFIIAPMIGACCAAVVWGILKSDK